MSWLGLALAVAIFVAACESLGGPGRLIVELEARGVSAGLGTDFDAGLLGGDPTTVCANDESVTVYEYADVDEMIDAAATINQDDPSMIGNGIVEWAGTPHFWLRDRVIVLYVGEDPEVNGVLREILGRPFAEGADPGRGVPGGRPPCERAT